MAIGTTVLVLLAMVGILFEGSAWARRIRLDLWALGIGTVGALIFGAFRGINAKGTPLAGPAFHVAVGFGSFLLGALPYVGALLLVHMTPAPPEAGPEDFRGPWGVAEGTGLDAPAMVLALADGLVLILVPAAIVATVFCWALSRPQAV